MARTTRSQDFKSDPVLRQPVLSEVRRTGRQLSAGSHGSVVEQEGRQLHEAFEYTDIGAHKKLVPELQEDKRKLEAKDTQLQRELETLKEDKRKLQEKLEAKETQQQRELEALKEDKRRLQEDNGRLQMEVKEKDAQLDDRYTQFQRLLTELQKKAFEFSSVVEQQQQQLQQTQQQQQQHQQNQLKQQHKQEQQVKQWEQWEQWEQQAKHWEQQAKQWEQQLQQQRLQQQAQEQAQEEIQRKLKKKIDELNSQLQSVQCSRPECMKLQKEKKKWEAKLGK